MKKRAIVIVNVGTPDSPETKDVRKYLFEFLNDPYVIDLPWLLRKFLVNLIIVPFRAPKSSKLYKLLWQKEGSPLLYYTESLVRKLQTKMQENSKVFLAMRYGNPNLEKVLKEIYSNNFEELVIVPAYPQYATSTTQSVIDLVEKLTKKQKNKPKIKYIEQFYNHPEFIKSYVKNIREINPNNYDHILFTYHGLPNNQVQQIHPTIPMQQCNCKNELPEHGKKCYKATCYETTRLIIHELGIDQEKYSVSFQSRLTKNWLTPFTDEQIIKLAQSGIKKLLVIAPSFVTDCLETNIELGVEYQHLFKQNNGETFDLLPSLNDDDNWVESLSKIIG
jgi:ferrochelatase